MADLARSSEPCRDAAPVELHGHNKKLAFFKRQIERLRAERSVGPSEITVLEVGCSNARNVTAPLAASGYSITGIDIHAESIEFARRENRFPNARFVCAPLDQLSPHEKFDVVILSDVLEHVEDPRHLLIAAIQYLEAGGVVLISIPNGFGPYELEQRFLRVTGLGALFDVTVRAVGRLLRRPSSMAGRPVGGPAYNYGSGHIQFFHRADFVRLLRGVGLEIRAAANGALFGGKITYRLFGQSRPMASVSLALADRLPSRWVSTWYFCCSVPSRKDRLVRTPEQRQARDHARAQWNANPCGAVDRPVYDSAFFEEVESSRYATQAWQKEVFEFAGFAGRRVLEIGVGLGTDLKQFARNGAQCYGVDITETHLDLARRNFQLSGLDARLYRGDAASLPFRDSFFDCVYSFGVLHHVPDMDAALAEIRRVLKPGGLCQIAVYHRFSVHSAFLFLSSLRSGQLRKLGVNGMLATVERGADGMSVRPYVKLYSVGGLRSLLRDRGLRPVRFGVRHVDFGARSPLTRIFRKAEKTVGWYVCAIAAKPIAG